ncbi:ATP-binding protein [Alkalihalobacillus sp. MEB130]|uniref:ATP-binding protein n=1 Tax=Alkalihalobacillus sp. MEB130 TaxID=2976704 RepID=UPI0028DFBAE1|nr:ATP-binding protein [Alkalihalobacillus sp. MEB130]MDT8860397.1 ATP-binding protein [Alkalihalobacillus sp. MEB130]
MFGLEELLLNVLFLIVFLLFIPILLEINRSTFFYDNKNKIQLLVTALAVVACFSFPIPIMEGFQFDLRLVALTVGGLYGGLSASFILIAFTALVRLLIGGSGAVATMLVLSVLLLLLLAATDKFQRAARIQKVAMASFVSTSIAFIAILNSTFLFGASFSALFLLLYVVITFSTTAFIVYFYELIQDHILVHKRVIKAEKMEVVSHLASSISHEVRNPLTTVRGFMQMMLQNEFSEKKRKEYLMISIAEVDRATDIIRNYLTFAKPTPENNRVLSSKEEIERTLQIVMPLANMNGIEVKSNVTDLSFVGEEQQFQQCLLNITKNCIEAMPNKGKLTIETKEDNGQLLIVITDNGKGMSKEQLARIGEPYFTTKGREGTGLGLLVSMRIIESMSGKLQVKSEVNKGTSFSIWLPMVEEKAKEA